MRIALHDRDGHLIRPFPEDVPGWEGMTPFERNNPQYIGAPDRQMILPGVQELLEQFDLNLVVSNQGSKLPWQVIEEARWLMGRLPIQGFVFCPSKSGETAVFVPREGYFLRFNGEGFRKPSPGMVELLFRLFPEMEGAELFGFGDRLSDQQCFESVGAKFQWSDIARGYPNPSEREMS